MKMPPARGELSERLSGMLHDDPGGHAEPVSPAEPVPLLPAGAWGDDLHLALWCCYELHYRGFDDVDDGWEWYPAIIGFRGLLERSWLAAAGVAEVGRRRHGGTQVFPWQVPLLAPAWLAEPVTVQLAGRGMQVTRWRPVRRPADNAGRHVDGRATPGPGSRPAVARTPCGVCGHRPGDPRMCPAG